MLRQRKRDIFRLFSRDKISCIFLCAIFFITVFISCRKETGNRDIPVGNAVYYWKRVLNLSETEKQFLKDQNISRVYTRFFDVVDKNGKWMPEATLIFSQPMPGGEEIVPVVFIDSKALAIKDDISTLPPLILARVDSMMSKNGYEPAEEIQIDFDWAPSNRDRYFSFLSQLRDSLQRKGRRLSATIRLHQLSLSPPPVDYGVLMAYNMGNFKNPKEKNSIISISALKEYLPKLKNYPLPLRGALPLYSWCLLFHDNRFVAIARDLDISDTTLFQPLDSTHFRARNYMPLPVGSTGGSPDGRIYPGDVIRFETPSYSLLDSALRMMAKERKEITNSLILYHLDDKSINTFNTDEIKKLYSGG